MTYASEVLADSPDLYWKLNESSGTTAADSSGNGRNGTTTNVTFGSSGPVSGDTAAALAAGHITSTFSPTYTAVTVEAWFNLNGNTISGNPRLLSCGHTDTDNKGWDFVIATSIAPNGPNFYVGNNTTKGFAIIDTMSKFGLTTGWHHYVATWDGSNIRIYIDGYLAQYAGYSATSTIAEAAIAAGWNPTYSGDAMTGNLAHLAVYPTALSAARILAHYRAAVPFTGSATAWRDTVSGDGATNIYALADTTSTMTAYSGGLNGTYNGSVDHTQAVTGPGVSGTQFFNGGSGNNGQINSFPALATAFTLEMIARFFALPSGTPKGIIQIGSESNLMLRASDVSLRAGQLNGNFGGAGFSDPGSSNDLAVGRLYHIAMTYDGATGRLYVNGTQVSTLTASGSVASGTFMFPWDFANGREANCFVAGLAYTPSALSATKVLNHSNAALAGTGPAAKPVPPIMPFRAAIVRAATR